MRKGLFYIALLCLFFLSVSVTIGDDGKFVSDGSRAVPVHLIPLYDEDNPELGKESQQILADDELFLPFSTRKTCTECHTSEHNYDMISTGWHFNAIDPNVAPGRLGQPWILVDTSTATQIPLSYRRWPGTFRPDELGITPLKFVQLFGRQMPGGGPGEILDKSNDPDEVLRSGVTGKLEINCLSCHSAHPGYDQAEYALQIARQNFRWAATAACEFASVSGSTAGLSDMYDYTMPEMLDDPDVRPPTVTYRKEAFDDKNQVLFDIVRDVPKESCYFCHSNYDVSGDKTQKWMADEDVHIKAGLTCVDCHRNGLDHNITRGYEGEDVASYNPLAAVSTCKGCHYGSEGATEPLEGRFGAPYPEHLGIPPIHFDKLSCTACHSGPWPGYSTYRTKTSRAHALGTHNVNKSPEALPHIIYPVFAKQAGIGIGYVGNLFLMSSGKIAPHKLIWPAYWATMKDEKLVPLPVDSVKEFFTVEVNSGDWPELTEQQIIQALIVAASLGIDDAVYVCGGKVYYINDKGELDKREHPGAGPYLWPIAHDVRPAEQSLGAQRCEDCHSMDSAFFFGAVEVDSPIVSEPNTYRNMIRFEGLPNFYTKAFAFSFVFRPWLKGVTLVCCTVLSLVLLLYGLKALYCITKIMVGKD